jgi:hypothetical protein
MEGVGSNRSGSLPVLEDARPEERKEEIVWEEENDQGERRKRMTPQKSQRVLDREEMKGDLRTAEGRPLEEMLLY